MPPLESLDCVPYFEDGDRLTGEVTAPEVKGKRFCDISGNLLSGPGMPEAPFIGASDPTDGGNLQITYCAPGAMPLGVSAWSGLEREKIGLICTHQVVPITAGSNITAGQQVEVGTEGKAVPFGTNEHGVSCDKCLTGVSTGNDAMIKLSL